MDFTLFLVSYFQLGAILDANHEFGLAEEEETPPLFHGSRKFIKLSAFCFYFYFPYCNALLENLVIRIQSCGFC
ncbi:hypothetical protein VNO77_32808 [Canavalia gladiata]|uniref:Uncharacterized protein n=1 Tax=Canavalia gladiata TaxID=3824 RepID=A0AAN9Q4K5_CANGL